MKNTRYNHDFPHCKAVGCDMKHDCVHWLSLQEAEQIGLKNYETVDHCTDPNLGYVRVRVEK